MTDISSGVSPPSDTAIHSPFDFRESDDSSKRLDGRRSSETLSTTSRRQSERALAEATDKLNRAQNELTEYKIQHLKAMEQKQKLEEENEHLRQSILSQALENASLEVRREHLQLKQTLESYQSKIEQLREISLITAKVVDSRIKTKQGRQYVEYKLQIETDIRGTLVLWHRYSTFLNLAATLKAKNPNSDCHIPELQTQSLTGFFSDQLVLDRIAKLNEFLDVVTKTDDFQWGIRIDKDTCVYKRKNRRSSDATVRESISTLSPHFGRDSMYSDGLARASSFSSITEPM
ncbi:unnamed protein product [Albugo candida]|uniref:PX domain-containing protein n=1 Tax=Albugo candida TaxID=65357 RepID=A0A024G9L3_9STRA|nr:unnamed protein product [Albugo candida]|eukprot:CCI43007.1 unnamed protein product [Albugo candida]